MAVEIVRKIGSIEIKPLTRRVTLPAWGERERPVTTFHDTRGHLGVRRSEEHLRVVSLLDDGSLRVQKHDWDLFREDDPPPPPAPQYVSPAQINSSPLVRTLPVGLGRFFSKEIRFTEGD